MAGQGAGGGPQHPRVAVRPRGGRSGEPGQGSLHRRGRGGDRCIEGVDRRVGGGPTPRRRGDGHRDHVQTERRPPGVLPQRSTGTTPGSTPSCGWCPPTWRPTATSTSSSHGWVPSRRESLGPQVDSPQGRADADTAVPVRGTARGRRPVRRGVARRDGDEGSAVGRAAADRRAVARRRGTRYRRAAARGAAGFAEPRHVRW